MHRIVATSVAVLALCVASCGKKDAPDLARFCSIALGYANDTGRAVHIHGLKGPSKPDHNQSHVDLDYQLAGVPLLQTASCDIQISNEEKPLKLTMFRLRTDLPNLKDEDLDDLRSKVADSRADLVNVFWDAKGFNPLAPSDRNIYGKNTADDDSQQSKP